jgi:hypothetical protein
MQLWLCLSCFLAFSKIFNLKSELEKLKLKCSTLNVWILLKKQVTGNIGQNRRPRVVEPVRFRLHQKSSSGSCSATLK